MPIRPLAKTLRELIPRCQVRIAVMTCIRQMELTDRPSTDVICRVHENINKLRNSDIVREVADVIVLLVFTLDRCVWS